jgi:phage terminase large subunit-like protein
VVIPEGISTTVWPRVERRLKQVGVEFDPWQQGAAAIALGCRRDGKYAATVGGVTWSIPRQVGKTFTLLNLLIGLALEFPRMRILWTSHHNTTTTNTFRNMQGMVKRKAIAPLLAPDRSNGIRTANGQQEITFANGSMIMFGAREHGFGRGLDAIDVEVFDEAQILTIKTLEDMVPAANQARNKHGGLIFFIGTPPRPSDPGEVFTAKRTRALSGESKDLAYIEFSADEDADPADMAQVEKANPSYPLRTPLESIQRMRENIPDEDSWLREALGVWPKISRHTAVVTAAKWRTMRRQGPSFDLRPDAFGVDMSHGLDISVAGCWMTGDSAHLEEVWAGSDVAAAVEWITAVAGWQAEVVIDDISPASQMVPELKARNVNVRRSSARDMAKACLLFETRTNSDTLTHGGQSSALTDALMGARKRPISDAGGWGWDRRDSTVAIHPIVAGTLALLGGVTRGPKKPSGRVATVS